MAKIKLLSNSMIINILIFMVLGFIYGIFFDPTPLKILVLPLTILMIYPMMVTLNVREVFAKCSLTLQLITQLINFLIVPMLGFFIGKLFFSNNHGIAMGLLLISILPTSGMTITWTGLAKGNVHVAVKMTIIGLIFGTILAPIYILFLMGSIISISLTDTFIQIAKVIIFPLLLGYFTQLILKKRKNFDDIKKNFPKIAMIGVYGIIFTAISLRAKVLFNSPELIFLIIVPLFLFYLILSVIVFFISKRFNKSDGITLIYGTLVRNLSLSLAMAMTVFGSIGPDMVLIIALAYIVQVQFSAGFQKIVKHL